jgi:hypothetical protein
MYVFEITISIVTSFISKVVILWRFYLDLLRYQPAISQPIEDHVFLSCDSYTAI